MSAIISYAQNFEDVMLWRALKHIENGFYIDLGAQDPLVDSVSLAFHERGWQGIHVEPTPHYAQLLRDQRPGDTVIEAAVGNAPGLLTFFEIPDTGISTGDPQIAEQHRERGFATREITVPCVRLSSIFNICGKREIHWMKIDVEGFEWSALTSWGRSSSRPWIVVVESTLPMTQIESYQRWEPLLLRRGYSPVYFDGLNRYYISKLHEELKPAFHAPPNVFDGFAVNGTASTTLHHHLNARHAAEIAKVAAQVQSSSGEIEGLKQALSTSESSFSTSEASFAQQLHERLAQLAVQKEDAIRREQALRGETASVQAEMAKSRGVLDAVKDDLAAAMQAAQQDALESAQKLAVREREHAEQAAAIEQVYRGEVSALQAEVLRTGGLLDVAKDKFADVLQAAQQEALTAAQALAARERAYADQAAELEKLHRAEASALQSEIARLSSVLVAAKDASTSVLIAAKDDFAGRLQSLQQEALSSAQAFSAREREFAAQAAAQVQLHGTQLSSVQAEVFAGKLQAEVFAGKLQSLQEEALNAAQAFSGREREFAAQAAAQAQLHGTELSSLQAEVSAGKLQAEVFAGKLQSLQQEALSAAQAFSAREREFAAQTAAQAQLHGTELSSLRADVTRADGLLSAAKDDFARMLQVLQQEALGAARALAAREREYAEQSSAQLIAFQQRSDQEKAIYDRSLAVKEEVFQQELSAQLDIRKQIQEETARLESDLRVALASQVDACRVLEKQLSESSIELDISRHKESDLAEKLADKTRLAAAQARREAMLRSSVSWRMTSPLRRVAALFRKQEAQPTDGILMPAIDMPPIAEATVVQYSAEMLPELPSMPVAGMSAPHQSSHNSQIHSEHPMIAIEDADQILALHDVAFVERAYQSLLGREPDAEGGEFYLSRLRVGEGKAKILVEIADSYEAKKRGTEMVGLSQLRSIVAVEHVDRLLELQDFAFVDAVFQAFLGRAPDAKGGTFYLSRLRTGIGKAQIILEIAESEEAKLSNATVGGLQELIRAQKSAGRGGFLGIFSRAIRIERQTNRLESQLDLLANENRIRLADLAMAVGALEKSSSQRSQLDLQSQERISRVAEVHSVIGALQESANQYSQTAATLEGKLRTISDVIDVRFASMEAAILNVHQMISPPVQNAHLEAETLVPVAPPAPQNAHLETETPVPVVHPALQGLTITAQSHPEIELTPPVVFPLSKGSRELYYYVDHTILCPVNTGMQRVTRRLGRALLEAGELVRFVKWDDQQCELVLLNQEELAYLSNWHGPALSPAELLCYPARNGDSVTVKNHQVDEGHWLVVPEVSHINYQGRALTLDVLMKARHLGLKTAFVFYDAIPLRRGELNGMAPAHATYIQQLLLADLLVPISKWSCLDLVSFFHLHEGSNLSAMPRIATIPLPAESQLTPRVTTPEKLVRTDMVILSVGSIESRKNQVTLVHAFERYCVAHPGTNWQLVLVGSIHGDVHGELDRAMRANPRIRCMSGVADNELDAMYRSCAFTVFPSVEEGFGLPILESLWYAKPCICANFGAMAEVAEGGGCLTVDTRDTDAVQGAITRLMEDRGLLATLSLDAAARPMSEWTSYGTQFSAQIDESSDPLRQVGRIYYWVDHTASYPLNTGIQRVVRSLARALLENGLKLIPVKWDMALRKCYFPTKAELEHLANFNGPPASAWESWVDPSESCANDWMLIPELVSDPSGPTGALIKQYLATYNLRGAWIFYDAIPWKMQGIYPPQVPINHAEYMRVLNEFELTFPISHFSRNDLVSFLSATREKTPRLESRILACPLPGEFLESNRVTTAKRGVPTLVTILCVGTVEPRKNHIGLLQAFAHLVAHTKRPVALVIAGGSPYPELAAQVEHFIATVPGIRWERGINDARLQVLYDECDLTVYPTLEEGFGLPILESLWHARPCICRDSGAMAEVAEGGGCAMVEVTDAIALAETMRKLVEDDEYRAKLATEAIERTFKTWRDYGREIGTRMATERHIPAIQNLPMPMAKSDFYDQFLNLSPRPLLSICITTYNRAEWLSVGLRNLARLLPSPSAQIEIVVCDNTSTDNTPDVVHPYLQRSDFSYYRNPENVGMLGNLRVTAHHARGQYVWILGDDDLVKPGSIERVLNVIQMHPGLGLVYLNYAYTREDDAKNVTDLDKFLREGTPVGATGPDIAGTVAHISTQSENFFTAIYCLVFKRDHALRAYSQNTEGRPFSTMLTCIPTTNYVLHYMMDEPGYWLGDPQLVVNMNVSWMKYATIWILERMPEAHDLCEKMGADPQEVDRCRVNHIPNVIHWFRDIYQHDEETNILYFSPSRLMWRMKHLDQFAVHFQELRTVYEAAHAAHYPGASIAPSQIFANFAIN